MGVDEELLTRLRSHLDGEVAAGGDPLDERRIVGGTGFFRRGHLLCGVIAADLLVRIAPADCERVVGDDDSRPMTMGGRSSRSWVLVPKSAALRHGVMATWVGLAVDCVASLRPR